MDKMEYWIMIVAIVASTVALGIGAINPEQWMGVMGGSLMCTSVLAIFD